MNGGNPISNIRPYGTNLFSQNRMPSIEPEEAESFKTLGDVLARTVYGNIDIKGEYVKAEISENTPQAFKNGISLIV